MTAGRCSGDEPRLAGKGTNREDVGRKASERGEEPAGGLSRDVRAADPGGLAEVSGRRGQRWRGLPAPRGHSQSQTTKSRGASLVLWGYRKSRKSSSNYSPKTLQNFFSSTLRPGTEADP